MNNYSNPMKNRTVEQKKASSLKSIETRRKNKLNKQLIEENLKKEAEQKWIEKMYALSHLQEVFERKYLECAILYKLANDVGSTNVLYTETQIVSKAFTETNTTGIYFLIKNKKIVYVGQSVSVYKRILEHVDKDYDSYYWIKCPKNKLNSVEALYIHLFKPILNKFIPSLNLLNFEFLNEETQTPAPMASAGNIDQENTHGTEKVGPASQAQPRSIAAYPRGDRSADEIPPRVAGRIDRTGCCDAKRDGRAAE